MERMTIVIDTREQRPFVFPEEQVDTVSMCLDAGDYALLIDGEIDTGFAVERKSLDDFVGTVLGKENWPRFLKELDRMRHMPAIVILVEGSLQDIWDKNYNSGINAKFLYKRLAQLIMKKVVVQFCDDDLTCATYLIFLFNERRQQIERGEL